MNCGICDAEIEEDDDPNRFWSIIDESPVCEECVEKAVEYYGDNN